MDGPPSAPPPRPRGKASRKPSVLPAEAIERLRAKGGEANGSIAAIGKVLGTRSKSTAHRLLHQLAGAGLVRLETGRRGVAVALGG